MYKQIRCAVVLLLLCTASSSFATTPDKAAAAITARYRITTLGFLGNFTSIGKVLTPRREGLRVDRPSKTFKPNLIKDHRLVAAGGSDIPLADAHDSTLKPGEQLYLYGVSTGDDYVQLNLHTVASYVVSGVKGATPLQATTRFQYDKGLAGVTTQQLLDDINEWLDTEEEPRPAAAGPCPDTKSDIADGATSTVRLGQSLEEVTATLGPPRRQILLGAKTIFVYRNLKVIFMDGKVTDAE